jgi:hypothetical protein
MNTLRPHIPGRLQRIVSRCLRKRPEDRYPSATVLVRELRAARRDTETGLAQRISWRQRIIDLWEQADALPPSRYAWFVVGTAGLVTALYLSVSKIGAGGIIFLALAALFAYRHVRNRPQRVQDRFVRRVAKIPEVRLIVFQGRQATVVVDRSAAQLYNRINNELRICNRKLYSGQPMTVAIWHEVVPAQFQKLLAGPGVQYVREDRSENK